MYQQVYDPVSDSLGASTIFAVLPLLTRIAPARAVTQWVKTVDQLKWAILTVAAVLALAYS